VRISLTLLPGKSTRPQEPANRVSPENKAFSVLSTVIMALCAVGIYHLFNGQLHESGYPAIVGPSLASRSKDEVSESDFKTPGVLQKANVLVALTTDHPVSRIQYLPLCAGLAVKEGMSEFGALRAITIDAARICRTDHRLGSLKEGKDADIVIYDGNPLEIASSAVYTIVDGEIAWQNKNNT